MYKKPPYTKEKDFVELMMDVFESWNDVREYDDEHLYYDRSKSISDEIGEDYFEYPDEYETDSDTTTLSILFEQYLRYHNIVKETKIGLIPQVDGIDEKLRIDEKDLDLDGDKKIDTIGKLKDYLLQR